MKGNNKYFMILVMLSLCACRKGLPPQQYVQYVQDAKNGLLKNVQVSEWEYKIQYRPAEFILLTEGKTVSDGKVRKKRNEQLSDMAWFNISFQHIDGKISPLRYALSSRGEYDLRLNYFLNEAARSIKLICNWKDTLTPTSYLFENHYNLTPQETMVVGFHLPSGAIDEMQLSYEDRIFKTGIIKTIFRKEDLDNIPKLVY